MNARRFLVGCVSLVLVGGASTGRADQTQTEDGRFCRQYDYSDEYHQLQCPYFNNTTPAAGLYAPNTSIIYIDYYSNGGEISGGACRQSWTGGMASCNTPTNAPSGNGLKDFAISGFDSIPGTADPFDYYFVYLATDLYNTGGNPSGILGVGYVNTSP